MRCVCVSCGTYVIWLSKQEINDIETECTAFEGLALNPVPEVLGVANFSNEVGNCTEAKAKDLFYSMVEVPEVQSIKDYLARPVLYDTGTFTASAGSIINISFETTNVIRTYFSSLNWDRLRGAVGMRATIKFTLVTAATPFHQGLAYMAFQYGIGTTEANYNRPAIFNLATYCPHVRLNLAEDSMAELSVPFVSAREYITIDNNVADDSIQYGSFSMGLLLGSPVVAGQTPASYSLYLSLHDVELIGAVPHTTTNVVLQTGLSKTHSRLAGPSGITSEAKAEGCVSAALDTLADVATAVSAVPSLSSIGGAADWMLRDMSKKASAFGYSKPLDEQKWFKMIRTGYAGESQVDIPYEAYSLAPFVSNKLAISSALGCDDDDQMAFDNVLTRPSYIFRGVFADTAAIGDLIYGAPLSPSCFWYRDRVQAPTVTGNIGLPTTATGVENCFFPSTLCYVGDNFRMWRGAFRFRITFAKTKLHGGRVQFSYVPYTQTGSLIGAPSNTIGVPQISGLLVQPTGYSEVFDLKDSSVIDFVCPYISPDPYLAFNNAMGAVSMIVVNPLRVTGNAPTRVEFMVEVSAEPGFEFAVPKPSLIAPVGRTGVPAPKYQSGLEQNSPDIPIADALDSTSQHVIGEKFNSLKQMMMMPDWTYFDVSNAAFQDFVAVPWFKTNAPVLTQPISNTFSASWFASRSSKVANLFAFVNGSTAYTIHSDGTNVSGTTVTMRWWGNNGGILGALTDLRAPENNSFSSVFVAEEQPTCRFIVPTYSKYMRIPSMRTTPAFGGVLTSILDPTTYTGEYSLALPICFIRNNSGVTRRFLVGRAAADDAMASQFIGPPPCCLFPATSTNSPVNGGFSSSSQY